VIEAENGHRVVAQTEARRPSFLGRLMGQTWELSLPQLASLTVAIVLFVSLATVVGLRRWGATETVHVAPAYASNVDERVWQRRQLINYWKQRVEQNKSRWSPEMREKFERTMREIDEAVTKSLIELNRNPHDEVSEQMLNVSLTDELDTLKAFSDL
jgi:hypothetical protein